MERCQIKPMRYTSSCRTVDIGRDSEKLGVEELGWLVKRKREK